MDWTATLFPSNSFFSLPLFLFRFWPKLTPPTSSYITLSISQLHLSLFFYSQSRCLRLSSSFKYPLRGSKSWLLQSRIPRSYSWNSHSLPSIIISALLVAPQQCQYFHFDLFIIYRHWNFVYQRPQKSHCYHKRHQLPELPVSGAHIWHAGHGVQFAVIKRLCRLVDRLTRISYRTDDSNHTLHPIHTSVASFYSNASILAHRTIPLLNYSPQPSTLLMTHISESEFSRVRRFLRALGFPFLEWLLFYSRRFNIRFQLCWRCSSRHYSFYSTLSETYKRENSHQF